MTSGPEAAARAFALSRVEHHRGGRRVLDGVDLSIPGGAVTALLGPSGAGKSSLLRLLNRLDDPTSGSIRFAGRPISDYAVRALRRRVAFVFQSPVMFPGTVGDNLAIAAALTDHGTSDLGAALELAGMPADLADRPGRELSVGQQQRVNLARALITQPDVLLLDEPTSSLDPQTAGQLLETFDALARDRGLTLVMATHRLAEARRIADHVVMMQDGRVVEAGPLDDVWSRPTRDETRRFLHGSDGDAR